MKTKKSLHSEEFGKLIEQFAEACHKAGKLNLVVIGEDMRIVACSGVPKNEIANYKISSGTNELIDLHRLYVWASDKAKIPVTENQQYFVSVIAPVFSERDIIGAVAVIDTPNLVEPSDSQIKCAQTAAVFFGNYLANAN